MELIVRPADALETKEPLPFADLNTDLIAD